MKIGQLSSAPMNSAPVVSSLAGGLADPAAAEPGDDRGQQRQEDDRRVQGASAVHPVDVVDRDRAAAAEEDDEDGEADRGLGGGDGQHEHRQHLADEIAEEGEKATRLMFTASRISSIAISMRMTLWRLRKMPSTPSTNRIARDVEIMGEADHSFIPSPTSGLHA